MTNVYVARSNLYIEQVLSGEIPACSEVFNACQRQAEDLGRNFKYTFDEDRAAQVCAFIELLPHVKGSKWVGTAINLEPWQCFILTTLFGWIDSEGNRRFKVAYVEVPRKNAKSTLAAGIGLFMLAADGESGSEVYSAATTKEQAKAVWQTAHQMVKQLPALQAVGVTPWAHSITHDPSASTFKALARDTGGNLDGLNVYCGIIDELHAHKTREIWDVIESALGAREQPLIFAITTAGFNRAGVCYEQRIYARNVIDPGKPEIEDDELFGIIYTIDKDDDWTSEDSWRKANPNWDVSVRPGDIQRSARQAMQVASKQNNFLTKRLNVWVNADTAWMNMRDWDKCADVTLSRADFEDEESIVGLDLASKKDIAARVEVFRRQIKGKAHYYAFGKWYLPEAAVEESDNSQYQGWEIDNLLIATPGNITDFDWIENDLIKDAGSIRQVAYDPHQATQLVSHLMNHGFEMVEYPQNVGNMSEPMKEFEALVIDGRFHFDGDPVFTWQVSNVVCHTNAKDEIYPRKEQAHLKIDGAVATIIAIGRWLKYEDEIHAYAERGPRDL